jgi:hypothetical protein
MSQAKNPYLVTVIGVALMAIGEVVGVVRTMMFRAMMYRPSGFNGTGPGPGQGFGGGARFGGGGFGFGISNYVIIIGLIIAIVGVIWLGMTLKNSAKK